jgi:glycosyltransferase involved in cell wall biosynthesis
MVSYPTDLIIPCFNEATRLPLADFRVFLADPAFAHARLWFVNDGSTDATASVLETLRGAHPERVRVLTLTRNSGKAEAVRQGVQAALAEGTADFVGFLDADLATPLTELLFLSTVLADHPDCQMVFGSRVKRLGARIERKATRHYFGRVFATAASFTVPLPIYDTQCGAKVFRAELAAALFAEPFLSRWLFDLEIFARLIRRFGRGGAETKALEMPLNVWVEKGDSRLKPSHLLKVPLEMRRIYRLYRADYAKP